MLLGGFVYRLTSESYSRFYKELAGSDIPVSDMYEKDGELTLTVSAEYASRFLKVCKRSGCNAKMLYTFGAISFLQKLIQRSGLIIGMMVSAIMMYHYSDVVIQLKVDTEDETLRTQVIEVLRDEGITTGTYIPDIDLVIAERALKRKIDDISWAGITRTGCGLSIDIVKNIKPVKGIATGMPCHLIACENGVIEEVELLDGELKKCIGSGVVKGDMIVSGDYITEEDQWHEGETIHVQHHNYVRSIGKINGTFERVMTFEQPFEEIVKVKIPSTQSLYSIRYFDMDIPLLSSKPDGFFTSSDKLYNSGIFGYEFPLSLNKSELTEYDRVPVTLSEDEAFSRAEDMTEKYEKNFLHEYELKDKKITKTRTDSGVKLSVRYTLYGSIVKESEFFVPKNITDIPTVANDNSR